MKLKYPALFLAIAIVSGGLFLSVKADNATTTSVSDMSAGTLKSQIQQKQQQLTAVNQQLASTTVSLKQTQNQRVTLQQQVSVLSGNITSLNLGIQANTIKIQQLQLEQLQLQGDINDIKSSIGVKEDAIAGTIQALQRNDAANGNLLAMFIRNGSLANSVFEANNVLNLQGQLSLDIQNLKQLNDQYNAKMKDNADKTDQISTQKSELLNKKSIVQDQQQQKQVLLATTKNQESLFQKQLKDLQKQQEQINSDIEAIDAVLRTKIDPTTLPALGSGVLAIPISGYTRANVTQGYGATAFAQHEYVHKWHNGLDFGTPVGTPIYAAGDGVVAGEANEDLYCPRGAYGKFIAINHNNGLSTLYGHLSKFVVSLGDTVKRGQLIAYSGNTGASTGAHLHFTVFARSTFYISTSKACGPLPQGGDLNPAGYLF